MPETPIFSFVFIRKDMPIANQLVQVGHACQHAGAKWGCPEDCYMALFEVANEKALLAIEKTLKYYEFNHTIFYESHYPVGFSAICTAPYRGEDKERLSYIFRKVKLWEE